MDLARLGLNLGSAIYQLCDLELFTLSVTKCFYLLNEYTYITWNIIKFIIISSYKELRIMPTTK